MANLIELQHLTGLYPEVIGFPCQALFSAVPSDPHSSLFHSLCFLCYSWVYWASWTPPWIIYIASYLFIYVYSFPIHGSSCSCTPHALPKCCELHAWQNHSKKWKTSFWRNRCRSNLFCVTDIGYPCKHERNLVAERHQIWVWHIGKTVLGNLDADHELSTKSG